MKKRLPSLPSLAAFVALLVSALFPCALIAEESTTSPPEEEPVWSFEIERSSHIVRREEDRFLLRYLKGPWNFGVLAASLEPQFRDSESQVGLEASRAWGRHDLRAAVRQTEIDRGEEVVGGVRWSMGLRSSRIGVDAVAGGSDLGEDDFLVGAVDETVGSVSFFREAENGIDVEVFAHKNVTWELSHGTDLLLERLSRTKIAGVETLADVDPDENRIEDAVGVRVGFGNEHFGGHVYGKSGEQLVRGISQADDMTGFGGDLHFNADSWGAELEVDLRQVETNDGFDIERGRTRLNYWQRLGSIEWALGLFVQGEAQAYTEIFDIYDTGGAALSLTWHRGAESAFGIWAILEQDEPDFEEVGRVAFFYERGDRAYGLGVRRDEVGRERFRTEETGPMVFTRGRFGRFHIDTELSVIDGEAVGRLIFRMYP